MSFFSFGWTRLLLLFRVRRAKSSETITRPVVPFSLQWRPIVFLMSSSSSSFDERANYLVVPIIADFAMLKSRELETPDVGQQ